MLKDKNLFYYHKKIDKQVISVAQKILRRRVLDVDKMKHGEVNHVYKITTSRGNVLMRIFKNKRWPEKGKYLWIERQLLKHKIPHAKILYYSRSSAYFPNGLMITEFIEGWNGRVAVEMHKITLAQAYSHIGKILKAVHKISVKKFGLVNNGKGNYSDFLKWKLEKDVHERFKNLKPTKALPEDLLSKIEGRVTECFLPFNKRLKPVLNHGDANRDNGIFSKEGQWILIDWDNARSSTWLDDYSNLTFWADFRQTKDFAKRRLTTLRKSFFKGYGKVPFTQSEIGKIEYGLHIIMCMRPLPYYYFNKKNMKDFETTKRKLIRLLKKDF